MVSLCEMLEKEEIKRIQWIPTQQQLADCLVRKGVSSKKLIVDEFRSTGFSQFLGVNTFEIPDKILTDNGGEFNNEE